MRLLLEHMRRASRVTFIAALAVFGFHLLVVKVFVSFISKQPILLGKTLPKNLQTFFGMDRLPINTLNGLLSVAYQHPFMLAAMLSVPIIIASGLLAGEVERKTLALILARPIGRSALVLSCAITCIIACAVVSAAASGGTYAGIHLFHVPMPPDRITMFNITSNLFVLGLAVAGISMAFSAWASERNDAVGWPVTIVMLMYVWNFLAQIWATAKPYGPYSLFHYYDPKRLLMGTDPLIWDYQLLGIVAGAGLLYALIVYWARDFRV